MATKIPQTNSYIQLPADILRPIFWVYAEQETNQSPLETLLLVSRLWNVTASEHKQIWAIINIEIEDGPGVVRWTRLLSRRLERSGEQVPIFFRLENQMTTKHDPHLNKGRCATYPAHRFYSCPCLTMIEEHLPLVIRAIAGNEGSLCARWKAINLHIPTEGYYISQSLEEILSYPTPQLTSLNLRGITLPPGRNIPFLPSTPSLRHIHIERSCLPRLPNTSGATSIFFANIGPRMGFPFRDIDSIKDAQLAETLYLDIFQSPSKYILPTNLSSLHTLFFGGRYLPTNITEIHTANLKELGLDLWDVDHVPLLLQSEGIPLSQVTTLTIKFPSPSNVKSKIKDYQKNYQSLLQACFKVENIHGNRKSMPFILKLLREDCAETAVLCTHSIRIEDGEISKQLRAGMFEMHWDIDRFIEERGWHDVKESWEIFALRWD